MGAFDSRASKADRRIALGRLAAARRRRRIGSHDYRLRRRLARRAVSVAELQALLWDLEDITAGRDHWRYGRWRGPVRDGRELEIQRVVGVLFLAIGLLIAAAVVYAAFTAVHAAFAAVETWL
ncbi:hypothetical protein [Glycomyces xiaoerkulensis]|uniref:hypothetical protein n=1 Tax=Glycomyces xiaoerkulensis TaxID=2038139 RepID=UPI000C2579CE|nr:hypothetical protein [Glycomyces xiaoerkulensis]